MTGAEIGAIVIGGAYVSWWMRQLIHGGLNRDIKEINHLDDVLREAPKRIPRSKILSELDDPYLSDSYVKKIIMGTTDKNQLRYILERVSNRTHDYLPNLVKKRLEEVETQEYLKIIIKSMKDKMPTSFDTISDHLQHLEHFI